MKILNILISIIKGILTVFLSIIAIGIIGVFFWIQVKPWFVASGFFGNDTPQYIHYIYYYLKHPHFPVTGWDYFWHNGVPRAIDLTWLHFTLNSILAKSIGVYESVKIYPILSLALGGIFVFLTFYELSKSVFLSMALGISFVSSIGYYNALFSAGVVLSSTSQMFLPAQLYFLIRFAKGGHYRNLVVGSLMSALGLFSHGLLMMFFGFIPSFIFVFFAGRGTKPFLNLKTIANAVLFAVLTLSLAALGAWPSLLLAKQGGSTTTFLGGFQHSPEAFQTMIDYTDPGVLYGLMIGFAVFLIFFVIRHKIDQVIRPLVAIFIWYSLWMVSVTWTGNPMWGVLFPGRYFWVLPFLTGCLAAAFFAPLSSNITSQQWWKKFTKMIAFNIVKIPIFVVILIGMYATYGSFENFKTKAAFISKLNNVDMVSEFQKSQKDLLEIVDVNTPNVRLWTHDNIINTNWIKLSEIPLSEGYAHIWTHYSRLWEGWFYGVMAAPNWESNEIPQEMAKAQSLFFIDWYGIKYLAASDNIGEAGIAHHFYEPSDYIKNSKIVPEGRVVFEVADNYTSPIISSINAPVVGFVGGDESYMNFLKDLAMLNLNTSYLVPVKLAKSVGGIDSEKLSYMDAVVIYDFKRDKLGYGSGWDKVYDFTKRGGKVWIETGGDSAERENEQLPAVFPITKTIYKPLGMDWVVGGQLAAEIDFANFSKLDYKGSPWKISYTTKEAVKKDAKVLITQKDYPIAVIRNIDKGKVLWTGANFWYRPEEFRQSGTGMKEIEAVKALLIELFGGLSQSRVSSKVTRNNPENVLVQGEGINGVTFKENNWPGWKAKVTSGGKTKTVPIFTAGPELMYIPVPKDLRKGEVEVNIDYKGGKFYWFCFFLSIISLLVAIIYLITGNLLINKFGLKNKLTDLTKKFHFKVNKWWSKEEDEQ